MPTIGVFFGGRSSESEVSVITGLLACNLLRSTELSVIAVSEQVGFHSISSFNRCFSKITGHSPRSWRNLIHTASQETKDKQIILDFNGWMHPEKL